MNFYLNNNHRKYMGLKELPKDYEILTLKGKRGEEYYLFIKDNHIIKTVKYQMNNSLISMHETDMNYQINEEKTIVFPKSSRGKERKLNFSTVDSFNAEGNYFFITYSKENQSGWALIGNYTTQKTFYQENNIKDCDTLEKIKNWCDQYVSNSTNQDLTDVQIFSQEKRKHINYQENDYFRVKIGKNQYTYGRVIMDIYKRYKKGLLESYPFMGRVLLVETFHILTPRTDVSIKELENLKNFPSEYIQDCRFYYGEYEIIGRANIPKTIQYPIIYGRSIDYQKLDIIEFQCGTIYKTIKYENHNLIKRDDHDQYIKNFRNTGTGASITVENPEVIKKCIQENSNVPYWEAYPYDSMCDLRSPENKEYLKKVLKQFELEELFHIYYEEEF